MRTIILIFISAIILFGKDADVIKSQYYKSYDYEYMQKYDEAIKVLAPLYNEFPNGYTLNLRFGWLFYLSKKYNDSIKYYKKVLIISPYSIEAKLGLIKVYLATLSYKQAEQMANEIKKVDYYNYYANIYLVQSLIGQNKYDTAYNIISTMLSLYPTDVKYLVQLSVIYKAQNSKHLEQLYKDILTLDPNNVYVNSHI